MRFLISFFLPFEQHTNINLCPPYKNMLCWKYRRHWPVAFHFTGRPFLGHARLLPATGRKQHIRKLPASVRRLVCVLGLHLLSDRKHLRNNMFARPKKERKHFAFYMEKKHCRRRCDSCAAAVGCGRVPPDSNRQLLQSGEFGLQNRRLLCPRRLQRRAAIRSVAVWAKRCGDLQNILSSKHR